jgi:hypothetical protein
MVAVVTFGSSYKRKDPPGFSRAGPRLDIVRCVSAVSSGHSLHRGGRVKVVKPEKVKEAAKPAPPGTRKKGTAALLKAEAGRERMGGSGEAE